MFCKKKINTSSVGSLLVMLSEGEAFVLLKFSANLLTSSDVLLVFVVLLKSFIPK